MLRFPKWLPPAFLFAVGINALLLTGAVLLSGEAESADQDITVPTNVDLLMTQEEPPAPESEAPDQAPPKPQEAKPDLAPDLFQPDFGADLGGLAGEGAIAIDLTGGANSAMKKDFVFESYELDQAPRAVVKMPPVYPFKARDQGVEGVVQVKILVNEDGTVGEVLIVDARPPDTFDEAVLMAVPKVSGGRARCDRRQESDVMGRHGASLQAE